MISKGLFSCNSCEWSTPLKLFNDLDNEFHFSLDPCASLYNHKCDKFFTINENGLLQDWNNEVVFCNPPYGRVLPKWVKKCYDEYVSHNITIVMLIPARTDTSYFHSYIYGKSEIRFVKGRLKFSDSKFSAPFPSMIVIYRKK